MRQIVFLLLFSLGLLGESLAQEPSYTLVVKGVLYQQNGLPMPGASIRILIDSTGGFQYARVVRTDIYGMFFDKIAVPLRLRQGKIGVFFSDCQGRLRSEFSEFSIERPEVAFKFRWCPEPDVDSTCRAVIIPVKDSAGLVLNTRATGTPPLQYVWNTGDSTATIRVSEPGEYCVRVFDAKGCATFSCFTYEGGEPGPCKAEIAQESANTGRILYVKSDGVGPFTYRWSTGDSTQRILIEKAGTYCATVSDSRGCLARACLTIGMPNDSMQCAVFITPKGFAGGLELNATARGAAPFRFFWSNGQEGPLIQIRERGTYCVKVVDQAGCISSACYEYLPTDPEPVCQTVIWIDTLGGELRLTARTRGTGDARRIVWSTGETTASILPKTGGLFCVKVADGAGCVSTACVGIAGDTIPVEENYSISGMVIGETNVPGQVLIGQIHLLRFEENGRIRLVDSTTFGLEPNSTKFGFRRVAPGKYLLRAVPSRRLPNFLPTYFPGVLLWEEAKVIEIPSAGELFFPIRLQMSRPGFGPGVIKGAIFGTNGFDGVEIRGGDGLGGHSILLLDASGSPVASTWSDETGAFAFDQLPLGTYRVHLDIPGYPEAHYVVTLSSSAPAVVDLGFELTGDRAVITDLEPEPSVAPAGFVVSPNPAADKVGVNLAVEPGPDTRLQLLSANGQILRTWQPAGLNPELDLSGLPSGLYWLRLQTGTQVEIQRLVRQ